MVLDPYPVNPVNPVKENTARDSLCRTPAAECGKCAFHVGWQRCFEVHSFAGGWVVDCQSTSVKRLTFEQWLRQGLVRFCILPFPVAGDQLQLGDSGAAAVEAVAEHRAADVGKMQTDLVRSPSFWPGADQRIAGESLDDFVLGDSRASVDVFAVDCLLFAIRWMVANRLVDHVAIHTRHAREDGQILLLDVARLKLRGECVVRLIILGHDDDAAGVAVEPMHDTGPRRPATATERAEVMGECAGQRSFPMPLRGVDDHAGCFIDHDDRVILVHDRKRDILRRGTFLGRLELPHGHGIAGSQSQGCFARGVIDAHVSGVDRASQGGPAEHRQNAGKVDIQPLPRRFGRDNKRLRPRWCFN
jgi:hypothetical protein